MLIIEKLIFYILIFILPLQTRKILVQWGNGFNEWTSAYLYITDILLLILFILCVWRLRKTHFFQEMPWRRKDFLKHYSTWLAVFLILALFSIIYAANMPLSFYTWIKLAEFIAFFAYLRYNMGKVFRFAGVAWTFIFSGFMQACLVILQYANQSALGLKWLMESPLDIEKAGVAKIFVNNLKMIRAYGLLPHPNILAAFLIFSLFLCCFLWLRQQWTFRGHCFFFVVAGFTLIALWLTFSRTAIMSFVFILAVYCFLAKKKASTLDDEEIKTTPVVFSLLLVSVMFCALAWQEILPRFQVSLSEQAVGLRVMYNEVALYGISEYPLMGVGIGSFVWHIRQILNILAGWLHQPVHNLYLLISVEVGLVGLTVFLLFVWRLLAKAYKHCDLAILSLVAIILVFLLISLTDHFFWTIQQGQLMLWLALGLLAGYAGSRDSALKYE